jgi:SAM-dependent methyltransferase
MKTTAEEQKERVRAAYGEIARTRPPEEASACCRPAGVEPDYSQEEIASVPEGAYLGEGSGNPVRAARLQPGEEVIDLGCGAGMDVFLAANSVGRSGRVVGIDMTPEMLERARANAHRADYVQVEFRQADIEHTSLPAASADAVLSNCVINLVPDKAAVYREIFRVLRPNGRFAVADIVLRGEPGRIHRAIGQLAPCSCIATALEQEAYLATIRAAGFESVEVVAERPALSQPLDRLVQAQAITVVGRKPLA